MIALAGALALAATATACNAASGGTGGSAGGESKQAGGGAKPATIGLVLPQGDKYFQGIQSGIEAAAKKDGNRVVVVNTNNDAGAEASGVQNLIQRGVSAIIMQPATSSAGSIATMKSIGAAKIPLICFGNCTGKAASPDVVKGVVQSDNTALGTATGQEAARYIKEKLGGKAVVGILNCDSFEVCKLRKAGFKKALKAAGVQTKYVADQEGFLADKATPIATNMLSANPSINLLWAANEGGTLGEIAAVKSGGREVPVFGTDISDQLATALLSKDAILKVTTGQDASATAAKAYDFAIQSVAGRTNEPFSVGIPGIAYSGSRPVVVRAYLGQ
ncbi:substrate-binding domain-containing protein [Streptomyces sp. NPDC058741]|uniref:substrate-binding domain-containing protein n=1 Tax=unclassified Streptomyces TaxID=2593676 RepID=UPI0036CA1E82